MSETVEGLIARLTQERDQALATCRSAQEHATACVLEKRSAEEKLARIKKEVSMLLMLPAGSLAAGWRDGYTTAIADVQKTVVEVDKAV